MIGNDVVSMLAASAESDWRRPNYLNKIFTEREQDYILSSDCQESAVWILWSRKEAVYKILNRKYGIRKFNPISFSCQCIDSKFDNITYLNYSYSTKTVITSDFIHTIAVEELEYFAKIRELHSNEIVKFKGLPFYISAKNQLCCASVSHHGDFYFAVGLDFDS